MNNVTDKLKIFSAKLKQFLSAKAKDGMTKGNQDNVENQSKGKFPIWLILLVLMLWAPVYYGIGMFHHDDHNSFNYDVFWSMVFFTSSVCGIPLGIFLMRYLIKVKKWNQVLAGFLGYLLFLISIFALPIIVAVIVAAIVLIFFIGNSGNRTKNTKNSDYEDEYICKYCGKTANCSFTGDCRNSPNRQHDCIIKRSNMICKYCGHESYPDIGECRNRPDRQHVLLDGDPTQCKYCGKAWPWANWECVETPNRCHVLAD